MTNTENTNTTDTDAAISDWLDRIAAGLDRIAAGLAEDDEPEDASHLDHGCEYEPGRRCPVCHA